MEKRWFLILLLLLLIAAVGQVQVQVPGFDKTKAEITSSGVEITSSGVFFVVDGVVNEWLKSEEEPRSRFFIVKMAQALAQTMTIGFDKTKAGITSSGIAFLSDEWVKRSGYGQPYFTGGPTGWQRKPMRLNQFGYWEVNLGKPISGAVLFCFEMDLSDMYIPHILVDMGELKVGTGVNSVVDNKRGGYNFYATPVPKAPWER